MIQRIQTVFLFLAFVCSIMFFIFPIGNIKTQTADIIEVKNYGFSYFDANNIENFMSGWYVITLNVLTSLILLISIFLFKRRTMQIRLNVFNIFLQLGIIVTIFLFLYQGKEKSASIDFHTNILILLPIIEIIFEMLAIRYIIKDDLLVKTFDRIRK